MRVLWFTNSPCNYGKTNSYNGGGWMTALQDGITNPEYLNGEKIELAISFVMNGQPEKVEQDGVVYYPVPFAVKAKKDKILDAIRPNDVHRDEVLWAHYISHFKRVIDDFQPDIIEIFGSELYMGLASFATNRPCVLHIQGLLSQYVHIFLPPSISRMKYIFKDGLIKAWGNWQFLNYWNRSVYREKSILNNVNHVIGRTDWDRRIMTILNPRAQYHYGSEILRAEFYDKQDRQIPQKLTIITTISLPPYKGYDLLLKIAKILKDEVKIDFEWNVYGNVNPRLAESLTRIKHEQVNVKLCGVASATQLRDAILGATVYVHPSYTENSPNSICEAQILGVPVVATNVGGTNSLIEEGKSGLLFPATDPYIGAAHILRLYRDMEANITIGNNARTIALLRHDKRTIVNQLIQTYKEVIQNDRKTV